MPNTRCANCGGAYAWRWEEAFDKFGFGGGDGQVMTDMVAQVLREAGYTVETHPWGMHNVVIDSIKRNRRDLIPAGANCGYGDPRKYLPTSLLRLLDEKLPADAEVAS
jgi:hypothetical protein